MTCDIDSHVWDIDDPVLTVTQVLHTFANTFSVPVLTLFEGLTIGDRICTALSTEQLNELCTELFYCALESSSQLDGISHLLLEHADD